MLPPPFTIASLIAASYNLPFDPIPFERKANDILEQVEKECGWMYETEVNGKHAKIDYTIWSDVFKTPPNYPPHPPMPASRHPARVLHIPADYQSPEHSGTVGN